MKSRNLGQGKLKVSSIGLGCMGLSQSYPPFPDKKESIQFLHKAVEMGTTFFIPPNYTECTKTRRCLGRRWSRSETKW